MNIDDIATFSRLMAAVGTSQVGASLDTLMQGTLGFDMSCAYLFRFNHEAVLLHDGYHAAVPDSTLRAYCRGGYLLDPFYVACTNNHPAGLWRMSDLAPDSFFSSGFSISRDIHPCVSSQHGAQVEEIGFIIPIRSRVAVVYSLMRTGPQAAFTPADLARLERLAPVVNRLFELDCRLKYNADPAEAAFTELRSEDAFINILQGQLTETQRYISRLILQGHSNPSIAALLGISEGTVKVHKHNIYQRLGISTNSDLFRLFIGYLTREG